MIKKICYIFLMTVLLVFTSAGVLLSQDSTSTLKNAPHFASEIVIKPNPELEGTFKCWAKLINLETGEAIDGPNLVLVKGMEGAAGTAHDWLDLDTFLKASSDKEGKTVTYVFEIYYKGIKIGRNSCEITFEQ